MKILLNTQSQDASRDLFSGIYQVVHESIHLESCMQFSLFSPLKPCAFSNFPPLLEQVYSCLSQKSNFYNWNLGGIIMLVLHIWQHKSISISCCCMSCSPFQEGMKKWLQCLPTLLLLGSSFRVLYLWWLEILF